MNDYWHIPRASLASSAASSASSSNRSNKSHSNPPTVAKRATASKQAANEAAVEVGGKQRRGAGGAGGAPTTVIVHGKSGTSTRRNSEMSATSAAATAAAAAAVLAAANKRGSRSSQGSSDSNNSTRSAASGSLLLTAANLERFAEIHKKQQQHNKLYQEGDLPGVHHLAAATTTYNANLVQSLNAPQHRMAVSHDNNGGRQQQHNNNHNNNISSNSNDAVITLDPNLNFIKTKDLDSVSLASSMHFTMVNGEGGPPKAPKRGLCDRGRQVTVLIVSMSAVFLFLIMGMVYALEMRAREMPQS